MQALTDIRILVGITGGIAAYKSAELVRELKRAGAEVRVVMTRGATEFITPLTLQALSGHPVRSEIFDEEHEAAMGHIELARWADQIVVAPASADFIARLTAGMADDLLATLCLATDAPLSIAPAMNQQMWQDTATQSNICTLAERGVKIIGPASGDQACGEVGPGRMVEPAAIVTALLGEVVRDLEGVAITITAGPTREAIDPVRYISNHSSGRMGYALAMAARKRGARVRLVSGPVQLPTPNLVERVDVESAEEMLAAVMADVGDIFIGCAAVADYRVEQVADSKIKKADETLSLSLVRNPDILATVSGLAERPFTVGFAAETDNLEQHARDKLSRKKVDMIAANWVGARAEGGGFNSENNALSLFWDGGSDQLPMQGKQQIAEQLMARIAEHYLNKKTGKGE